MDYNSKYKNLQSNELFSHPASLFFEPLVLANENRDLQTQKLANSKLNQKDQLPSRDGKNNHLISSCFND